MSPSRKSEALKHEIFMHELLREIAVVSKSCQKEPTSSIILAGGYQLRDNLQKDILKNNDEIIMDDIK